MTAKRREGILETDPIWKYLDSDGASPSFTIMNERVRSSAYDPEYKRRLATLGSKVEALEFARTAGKYAIRRWLERI